MSLPWDVVPSHKQYFVLITGANSGVGLGIGQRLIDEFLASRSLTDHLVLIPTTRTATKSSETIQALRLHLAKAAQSAKLRARAGGRDYDPRATVGRVHLLSVELDLCDLGSVYGAADRFLGGDVRDPTGVTAAGAPVAIPRIDAALFNAGYGGWSGVDWLGFVRQAFSVGVLQAMTFPTYKSALPSKALPKRGVAGQQQEPDLAEVFCANVFGHYILAHELMPLLRRSRPSAAPARIIWTSSIDAERRHLDFDDFQALKSAGPYESSKRITDLICLGADSKGAREASASYFSAGPDHSSAEEEEGKPRLYLSHPGVVCTALFPLNALQFLAYYVSMYLLRWLGSPWHVVDSYLGACAIVWLALADQEALDAAAGGAHRVKWGSACDRRGRDAPKMTEVDGWGWEGRPEDAAALERDTATGVLRKLAGRKWDAAERATRDEDVRGFEDDAARAWTELERLRAEWETIMGRRDVKS